MWPKDVGIHAIELIVPSRYVDQADLEQYDGVSSGKYRIGLGQDRMGFCDDREDINSLCLTVVDRLMKRCGIKPTEIGRLEVGTETLVDKSKSVKTVLMQLFESHGNTDVEGVDTTNACYGGTAALFNAIAWIESSYWDGRYALVVAADIAVYAKGPARPTGGAGAVAMLIGAEAPLIFERGLRATHMRHAYDFYKPDMSSEYPTVDGPLSIRCYLDALDNCYRIYGTKYVQNKQHAGAGCDGKAFDLTVFDSILFHTPYCKLVQKSFARLALNDYLNATADEREKAAAACELFKSLPDNLSLEGSYFDKVVEKAFVASSNEMFDAKTRPSLMIANQVGNMYTPSLYGGLVSLLIDVGNGCCCLCLERHPSTPSGACQSNSDVCQRTSPSDNCKKTPADCCQLNGRKCATSCCSLSRFYGNRIGLFSYGSGLASSMFSIRVTSDADGHGGRKLRRLISNVMPVTELLAARRRVEPAEFSATLELRAETAHRVPYVPVGDVDRLFDGTYYLASIDDMHRRRYEQRLAKNGDEAVKKSV